MQVVQGFNADPAVHGILVQLPLPKHINEQRILDAVSFEKDVDGFHPQNIGCLAMRTRDPLFICCTPKVMLCCTSNCTYIILFYILSSLLAHVSSCCISHTKQTVMPALVVITHQHCQ